MCSQVEFSAVGMIPRLQESYGLWGVIFNLTELIFKKYKRSRSVFIRKTIVPRFCANLTKGLVRDINLQKDRHDIHTWLLFFNLTDILFSCSNQQQPT
jgi:hypothetical protein